LIFAHILHNCASGEIAPSTLSLIGVITMSRHSSLMKSASAVLVMTGLMQVAIAADQPQVQPQAPTLTPPAALRPRHPDMAQYRPHQEVKVVEAEDADGLAAKLQAIVDDGLNIVSMQSVVANGKTMVVVLGYPMHRPSPMLHMPVPTPPANGAVVPAPTPVPAVNAK
jgi:hypothetical protein